MAIQYILRLDVQIRRQFLEHQRTHLSLLRLGRGNGITLSSLPRLLRLAQCGVFVLTSRVDELIRPEFAVRPSSGYIFCQLSSFQKSRRFVTHPFRLGCCASHQSRNVGVLREKPQQDGHHRCQPTPSALSSLPVLSRATFPI